MEGALLSSVWNVPALARKKGLRPNWNGPCPSEYNLTGQMKTSSFTSWWFDEDFRPSAAQSSSHPKIPNLTSHSLRDTPNRNSYLSLALHPRSYTKELSTSLQVYQFLSTLWLAYWGPVEVPKLLFELSILVLKLWLQKP